MENDSITKYNAQQTPQRKVETACTLSQQELYRNLPTNYSVSTMVAAQTPTLAKIKNEVSPTDVRALLSIAVCELCDFFNVGKNMNDKQIAMTVDLILEHYWYMHLEEIKFCFRRAMRREKLYDRLDGSIIMGWLNEYDAERTEAAMRLSAQASTQEENAVPAPDAVDFKTYLAELKERAKTDARAAKLLDSANHQITTINSIIPKNVREEKEKAFKLWRMKNYLQGKKI